MVAAVIAGGRGRRLGGAKALAPLAGRPLVAWALAALRAACPGEVAVVARAGTALPPDLDAPVWLEPDDADHHPRRGLVHALERAEGRAALVLAVDLPLVPRALLRALAAQPGHAIAAGQPLCGRYGPDALAVLRAAPSGERLTATVDRLGPIVLPAPADALLNVNTPADLARAEALVAQGRHGADWR